AGGATGRGREDRGLRPAVRRAQARGVSGGYVDPESPRAALRARGLGAGPIGAVRARALRPGGGLRAAVSLRVGAPDRATRWRRGSLSDVPRGAGAPRGQALAAGAGEPRRALLRLDLEKMHVALRERDREACGFEGFLAGAR